VNTTLELLDHAPESFVLSDEQCAAMDDMGSFIDSVRIIVKADFKALDFSDSAVSELADIYIGV
jgi:hypothetical protein